MDEFPKLDLLTRIKHEGKEPRQVQFGSRLMDRRNPRYFYITGQNRLIACTNTEAQILWLLMCVSRQNADGRWVGGIISADEFEQWFNRDLPDDKDIPMSNRIQVHITHLNQKLTDATNGAVAIKSHVPTARGYYLEIKQPS